MKRDNSAAALSNRAQMSFSNLQNEMCTLLQSQQSLERDNMQLQRINAQLKEENTDLKDRLVKKNEELLLKMTNSLPKKATEMLLLGIYNQNFHLNDVGDIAVSQNLHQQLDNTCTKQMRETLRQYRSMIGILKQKCKSSELKIAELDDFLKQQDIILTKTKELLKAKCSEIAELETHIRLHLNQNQQEKQINTIHHTITNSSNYPTAADEGHEGEEEDEFDFELLDSCASTLQAQKALQYSLSETGSSSRFLMPNINVANQLNISNSNSCQLDIPNDVKKTTGRFCFQQENRMNLMKHEEIKSPQRKSNGKDTGRIQEMLGFDQHKCIGTLKISSVKNQEDIGMFPLSNRGSNQKQMNKSQQKNIIATSFFDSQDSYKSGRSINNISNINSYNSSQTNRSEAQHRGSQIQVPNHVSCFVKPPKLNIPVRHNLSSPQYDGSGRNSNCGSCRVYQGNHPQQQQEHQYQQFRILGSNEKMKSHTEVDTSNKNKLNNENIKPLLPCKSTNLPREIQPFQCLPDWKSRRHIKDGEMLQIKGILESQDSGSNNILTSRYDDCNSQINISRDNQSNRSKCFKSIENVSSISLSTYRGIQMSLPVNSYQSICKTESTPNKQDRSSSATRRRSRAERLQYSNNSFKNMYSSSVDYSTFNPLI